MYNIDFAVRELCGDLEATEARLVLVSRTQLNRVLNYIAAVQETAEAALSAPRRPLRLQIAGVVVNWFGMPLTIVALATGFARWPV